jgi:hypothetical protein
MKKLILAAALGLGATGAHADAGFMVGVSYNFDGRAAPSGLGFTAKVLTSDKEDKWVGAAGVTLLPWAQRRVGVDVSAGYTFDNSTVLVGYDFLQQAPQVSAGWSDTDN